MHWKHFLALERDLEICSRYIEFDTENYNVYSVELVKLILSVGSEIDVVLKELCRKIDSNKKPKNIDQYREIILNKFKLFSKLQINVLETKIELTPWQMWSTNKNPIWWKTYNIVKHNRTINYAAGNLECVLKGFAGLMAAILYNVYMEDEKKNIDVIVRKESRFFETGTELNFQPAEFFESYRILI